VQGGKAKKLESAAQATAMPEAAQPPLSPIDALTYALVISKIHSSNPDKRELGCVAIEKITDLWEPHKDSKSRAFLTTVWGLVSAAGLAIGESNMFLNRELERESSLTDSKIATAEEAWKARMGKHKSVLTTAVESFEHAKQAVGSLSIPKIVASIGVTTAVFSAAGNEIMNMLVQRFPALSDVKHFTAIIAAALATGAIVLGKKIFGRRYEKKKQNAVKAFELQETDANADFAFAQKRELDRFRAIESDLRIRHMEKVLSLSANVFAKAYRLCIMQYPEAMKEDPHYEEYMLVRNDKGRQASFQFLLDIGKKEAAGLFTADPEFLREPKAANGTLPT
jgi:hypothetical protein